MNAEKLLFLKEEYVPILKTIPPELPPKWGKMTFQHMVEHMADFIRISSGKTIYTDFITPADKLSAYKTFIMSDKQFRENTVSPILPEGPSPLKNKNVQEALEELNTELDFFFTVFEKNHQQQTRNPIFGDLNYEENIELLYKHAMHHLRQFGNV
jgi:hypothetical protein